MKPFLPGSRECVYVLDLQVRKAVHELYRKIFAVLNELPFSDLVSEGLHFFHF